MGTKTAYAGECGACVSRRQFIKTGVQSLSMIPLSGASASFLAACSQQPLQSGSGGNSPGQAPGIANNSNNLYAFSFTDYPALQSPGGSIQVTINAASGVKSVFITRVDATTVDTVSTICTHQSCTLNAYNAATQQYQCPCHGSIFSADGSVVTGPAAQSLPVYSSTITSSGVEVTVP